MSFDKSIQDWEFWQQTAAANPDRKLVYFAKCYDAANDMCVWKELPREELWPIGINVKIRQELDAMIAAGEKVNFA